MSSKETKKEIILYTDGSCSPNPGNGGYGIVALTDPEIHISHLVKNTTNNIMEVTAIIEAVKLFKNCNVNIKIYSDSKYAINCAEGKWKRKVNLELWKEYDTVSKGKNISFKWVKGHSGDYYNDLVDRLAKGIF